MAAGPRARTVALWALLALLPWPAASRAEEKPRIKGFVSVAGVVRNADGSPAAGIPVRIARERDEVAPILPAGRIEPGHLDGPATAGGQVVRTDAEGRFMGAPEVGRKVRVTVAPGETHASHIVVVRAGTAAARDIVVNRHRASPVHVRLVGRDGKGVRGWVEALFLPTATHWYAAAGGPLGYTPSLVRTDAEGKARILVPDGYSVRLSCGVAGKRVRHGVMVPRGYPGVYAIAMEEAAGASMHGRVLDDAGRGLAGARVFVRVVPAPPVVRSGAKPAFLASAWDTRFGTRNLPLVLAADTTDADGRYVLSGLPPGHIEDVLVLREGHPPHVLPSLRRPMKAGDALEMDVPLAVGGQVRGEVVDEVGRPVVGAEIELFQEISFKLRQRRDIRHLTRWTTRTDEQGRWTLGGVSAGTVYVNAKHDAYVRIAPRAIWHPSPWTVQVVEGATVESISVMRRGVPVVGYVLEPSGAPVAGTEVLADFAPGSRMSASQTQWRAYSDAAGRFAFDGLPVGGTLTLALPDATTTSNTIPLRLALGPPAEPVRMYRRRGTPVSGQVVDASRQPLQGVAVRLRFLPRNDDGIPRAFGPRPPAPPSVRTDAAGRFRFREVPAGTWLPEVSGLAKHIRWDRVVVPPPDGEPIDIQLQLPGASTAHVRVVTEGGLPVAGQPVMLHQTAQGGWSRIYLTTDVDGRVSVSHVTTRSLGASARGANTDHAIPVGDEGVTEIPYVLPPEPALVPLHVMGPEGEPIGSAIVIGPDGRIGTVHDGLAMVPGSELHERKRVAIVDPRDAVGRRLDLAPMTGLQAMQEHGDGYRVRLRAGHVVHGVVHTSTGEPLAGVPVQATQRVSNVRFTIVRAGVTDAEGRFELVGFTMMPAQLVVRVPEGFIEEPERRVQTDTEVDVTLFEPGGLAGRVVGLDGEAFPNLSVKLRWRLFGIGDWRTEEAVTDAEGRFAFERVHPEARLFVRVDAFSWQDVEYAPVEREVPDLSVQPVELRLERARYIEGQIEVPAGHRTPALQIMITSVPLAKGGIQKAIRTKAGETRFRYGPVPAGRYLVQVVQPLGYVHPGSRAVKVPMEGPLVLQLEAREETKVPEGDK
ncbi:MAG: carboxypeptidase-like regulatory domain-containing protein [Planctomycetota bacterium]|nr:carboxypeptidase-like regulatory domain-containing protein [Planctomycetota bacterium]